jgi:hypothetical protein
MVSEVEPIRFWLTVTSFAFVLSDLCFVLGNQCDHLMQVQSIASFCSTLLGTAVRIPCEVLKQRLQAGMFNNVGEAIVGTWKQDGPSGFFRGTGATLCREVPLYVVGMGLYAESKKVRKPK